MAAPVPGIVLAARSRAGELACPAGVPERMLRYHVRIRERHHNHPLLSCAILLDSLLVLPESLDEHFFTTLETEEPDMMQRMNGYERFILRRERAAGMEEGRVEGEAQVQQRQLTRRFGPLPQETQGRLKNATAAQLETWSLNFVDASTLDDVFRD